MKLSKKAILKTAFIGLALSAVAVVPLSVLSCGQETEKDKYIRQIKEKMDEYKQLVNSSKALPEETKKLINDGYEAAEKQLDTLKQESTDELKQMLDGLTKSLEMVKQGLK